MSTARGRRWIRGYDYVAIGHVTLDAIEDGRGPTRYQPGGGAFYSALQAARLGLRASIVTKGAPAELERLLGPYRHELDAIVLEAEHTTTLLTRGSGPQRRQWLRAWAGPIDEPLAVSASIVHFAPVARELTANMADDGGCVQADAALVCVTPQGWVRSWGADGLLSPAPLDIRLLPAAMKAAVFSRQERASCAPLLAPDGPGRQALVAITAGSDPIELHIPGSVPTNVPPIRVEHPQEDLGAGDVFAAALFIALWRGEPAVEAARYASAAAAARMLGEGPEAVGNANAVAALMQAAGA